MTDDWVERLKKGAEGLDPLLDRIAEHTIGCLVTPVNYAETGESPYLKLDVQFKPELPGIYLDPKNRNLDIETLICDLKDVLKARDLLPQHGYAESRSRTGKFESRSFRFQNDDATKAKLNAFAEDLNNRVLLATNDISP